LHFLGWTGAARKIHRVSQPHESQAKACGYILPSVLKELMYWGAGEGKKEKKKEAARGC
jgi:hypothetical protein